MPDTRNPQVPIAKDPNDLPDMSPPQPEPPASAASDPSTKTPVVPSSDPVPVPPTPTTPPQESPPQVPASTLSSSEQSINPGENTSGMGSGSEVPPGVDGWGWGPFFFTGIWGIFNNVWIALLAWIPIFPVGLIMAIVLGSNGRKWAWQKKKWRSVEHFNEVQHQWSRAGVIIGVLVLLAWLAIFFLVFVVVLTQPGGIEYYSNY